MVYDLLVIVFIIRSAGVEECRLHFAVVFSIVCHYCHYCHYYNLILHFTFTIQYSPPLLSRKNTINICIHKRFYEKFYLHSHFFYITSK